MYPGLNDADIHAVQIRYEQLGRDARSIRRPLRITVPLRSPDVGRIVAVVRSVVPAIVGRFHLRPATRHAP
jgi:hypothetical protein